ncbi:MAG: hypothetical protein RLZZ453_470 [Chlamydiota bacterium]
MKWLSVFLCLFSSGFTKVYDGFCFFNEFEVLRIRLEELWDVVDYFVLVESIETQKGEKKPLYFCENAHLFEKYARKIIPIAIEETHPEFTDSWERENYQRNQILRGLVGCQPDDLIIISDLDEIPRKTCFPSVMKYLSQDEWGVKELYCPPKAISLQQTLCFHQLNRIPYPDNPWRDRWIGTVFTTYKNLIKHPPQYFRNFRGHFPSLPNAGWHFTWMGGIEKIRQKHASVVEGNSACVHTSDEVIQQQIEKHPVVPIDTSFPQYVQDNIDYFISIGFIAPY